MLFIIYSNSFSREPESLRKRIKTNISGFLIIHFGFLFPCQIWTVILNIKNNYHSEWALKNYKFVSSCYFLLLLHHRCAHIYFTKNFMHLRPQLKKMESPSNDLLAIPALHNHTTTYSMKPIKRNIGAHII